MGVLVSSINTGRQIANLVYAIDSSNRLSTIRALDNKTLINGYTWTTGQGSTGVFAANGQDIENVRVPGTDPWGANSIVWQSRPEGGANSDGGWNTSYPTADVSKRHRYSVWCRKVTAISSGSEYFGGYAGMGAGLYNANNSFRSLTTNLEEVNPYWDARSTEFFVSNTWYLITGSLHPFNTNITSGPYYDTGIWRMSLGTTVRSANVGGTFDSYDAKAFGNTESLMHRTYHYYSNANCRMEFANPRIDVCDGNQPTLGDLLYRGPNILKNLANNYISTGRNSKMFNQPVYTSDGTRSYFTLNGTSNYIASDDTYDLTGTNKVTVELVVRLRTYPQVDNTGVILFEFSPNYNSYTDAFLITYADDSVGGNGFSVGNSFPITVSHRGNIGYNLAAWDKTLVNDLEWHHWVAIFDKSQSSQETYLYIDGVLRTPTYLPVDQRNNNTNNFGNYQFFIGSRSGGAGYANADIGLIKVYNTRLTEEQIIANYNAYSNRFGI